MRLIDLNKIPHKAFCGDRDDLVDALLAAPTVDAVPVVHGRWVKVHDEVCYWLACSVCGEEIPKRFGTDYYTNYCPNCGAKMDGGVNDGKAD